MIETGLTMLSRAKDIEIDLRQERQKHEQDIHKEKDTLEEDLKRKCDFHKENCKKLDSQRSGFEEKIRELETKKGEKVQDLDYMQGQFMTIYNKECVSPRSGEINHLLNELVVKEIKVSIATDRIPDHLKEDFYLWCETDKDIRLMNLKKHRMKSEVTIFSPKKIDSWLGAQIEPVEFWSKGPFNDGKFIRANVAWAKRSQRNQGVQHLGFEEVGPFFS